MMNGLAIRGIGLVGGFGCGLADFKTALAAGVCVPQSVEVAVGGETVTMPLFTAETKPLERFVDKRALRRIDHFSRLALLGGCLALEDAGRLGADRRRLGVIIATGYGATATTFAFLDTVLDDGDALASPTHFSSSVHNAAAAHTAILLKATGPSLTVSQFEMSVPSALLTAWTWLQEGRVDAVLFGGVDEACAVLRYCWRRFFPATEKGGIRPLDFASQTAIPAEGAAFFLLTADAEPARYGRILDIRQGNCSAESPELDPTSIYLLGADGQAECGAAYPHCLPDSAPLAAYTPLYGSLPVGPAFDLAVAALACRDNCLPPPPAQQGELPMDLIGRSLNCLKLGRNGDYGLIRVERDAYEKN